MDTIFDAPGLGANFKLVSRASLLGRKIGNASDRWRRTLLLAVQVCLVVLLSSCGGGGGGSSAPPAPPSIQSFSPPSGLPNSSVIVSGTSLASVTGATIGTTTATVSNVSATQVTVTVPAGATSGPIALTGTGVSLQTSTSFTVSPEPTITTSVAQGVGFGGTFVIAGTNLTEVKTFSVGGTALGIASVSDTSVSLTAPASALTGTLVLVDTAGNQISTSLTLTAFNPTVVTVGSFSPTSVAPGNTLTVTGTALNNVTAVAFYDQTLIDTATSQYPANTPPSIMVAPSSTTGASLTVVVPEFADGSGFNLLDSAGTVVATSGSTTLTVVKPILADWVRTRPTSNGLSIYIHGAQLNSVTSATVGTSSATIVSQSLDTLQLTVPTPVASPAPIVLNSSTQAPVAAGVTSVIASGLSLNALEFAQVHSQQSSDPLARLTPGRPVLVRASVTADTVQSPTALLTATVGSTTLGTVPMLPTPFALPSNSAVYDSGALDTSLDSAYSLQESFFVVLPGNWVQPGVNIQVSVTPDPTISPGAAPLTVSATPAVGLPAAIDIVVVPLQIGGVSPIVPTTSQVQSTLAAAYPYPVGSINVSQHAAVTVPSTTLSFIATSADLTTLLNYLETLRVTEGSNATYYGLYSGTSAVLSSAAEFVGLGHLNSALENPSGWKMSAVGYDRTPAAGPSIRDSDPFSFFTLGDWQEVMIHELGHVHSRAHTGCYNAGSTPPQNINFNFPYDLTAAQGGGTGAVGFSPLYLSLNTDTTLGSLAAPYAPGTTLMLDVMGYCQFNGTMFFSTYNYYGVQQFAEAHNKSFPASTSPGATTSAVTTAQQVKSEVVPTNGYLTLSGTITADGVKFFPASAHNARAALPKLDSGLTVPTVYRLQIRTSAGTVVAFPIYPGPVADVKTPTMSFFLTIPNPGSIDAVTLFRAGVALPEQLMPTNAVPGIHKAVQARVPLAASGVSYSFAGDKLTVQWNSTAEPFLSVTGIYANGARAVLASQATGGTAVIDVGVLTAGEPIELGLSSTHSARVLMLLKPIGTSVRGFLR